MKRKAIKHVSGFEKDWRAYLNGLLNRRIIHFLDLTFRAKGITRPTLQDVAAIDWQEIENSWLSVASSKELAIFQQQIKKNNDHAK